MVQTRNLARFDPTFQHQVLPDNTRGRGRGRQSGRGGRNNRGGRGNYNNVNNTKNTNLTSTPYHTQPPPLLPPTNQTPIPPQRPGRRGRRPPQSQPQGGRTQAQQPQRGRKPPNNPPHNPPQQRRSSLDRLQSEMQQLTDRFQDFMTNCERCRSSRHKTDQCPLYSKTAARICSNCTVGKHFRNVCRITPANQGNGQ